MSLNIEDKALKDISDNETSSHETIQTEVLVNFNSLLVVLCPLILFTPDLCFKLIHHKPQTCLRLVSFCSAVSKSINL